MTDMASKDQAQDSAEAPAQGAHADRSAWLIWAGIVLVTIAILPFAVRNQDMVRALARMCGIELD